MTERRTDLRAADIDRQFVADKLKDALEQGRLSLEEYDERLVRINAARTYGELDQVVIDLPSVIAAARAHPVPAPADIAVPGRGLLKYPWWAWAITAFTIIVLASLLVGCVIAVSGA